MSLIIQIQSIAYTFIFGIFFSFLFNALYKILFTRSFFLNLITNTIFLFITSTLYFYFLLRVNFGVIHIYLLLVFVASFFLYNHLFKKRRWL